MRPTSPIKLKQTNPSLLQGPSLANGNLVAAWGHDGFGEEIVPYRAHLGRILYLE